VAALSSTGLSASGLLPFKMQVSALPLVPGGVQADAGETHAVASATCAIADGGKSQVQLSSLLCNFDQLARSRQIPGSPGRPAFDALH
jgi:hypothetical protein